MARQRRDIEVNIGNASVFKRGVLRWTLSDPYHMAVAIPPRAFALGLLFMFALLNLLFALGYWAAPGSILNARSHSLYDAFFFSIETMATVGYGAMSPGSTFGHILSSLEIVAGIAFTAVATGIIFVRFSRPMSRMMFAQQLVITEWDGKRTLMVRVAYSRASSLINAKAELDCMLLTTTKEGHRYRAIKTLKLIRARMPALILAWTIMHVIDEHSPLYGLDRVALDELDIRIMLTIEARDPDLGADVYDFRAWSREHVLPDRMYDDVVTIDDKGVAYADLDKLSDLKPSLSDSSASDSTLNQRSDSGAG